MFAADHDKDFSSWDYITGDIHEGMCIASDRYYHLQSLVNMSDKPVKFALRDSESGAWTKWKPFYEWTYEELADAYEIHRSILPNEIIIESDYLCDSCKELNKIGLKPVSGCNDCYAKNQEATRILGKLIEHKGFTPHYYYSGNKSIHIHLYIDFSCFLTIDMFLQEEIIKKFRFKGTFVKSFMEWVRHKLITFWDMDIREFDQELIRSSHLIRSEMSKNKVGYKTYLGDTYKDISFIPTICNKDNMIYPQIASPVLSRPNYPQELIEEFLRDKEVKRRKKKVSRREWGLQNWMEPVVETELRAEVKFILSDEFKNLGDGFNRGMFILSNEFKKVYGEEVALDMLKVWNSRMEKPFKEQELTYRIRKPTYDLSTAYIKGFLESLGCSHICKKADSKVYK